MISVIVPFYNCENYLKKCIDSITNQTEKHFKCYLIDDMSTDKSYYVAQNIVHGDGRFVIIKRSEKFYQCRNYFDVAHNNIPGNDIIVLVDGDDRLSDKNVLKRIKDSYKDNKTFLTYGSYIYSDGRPGMSVPATIEEINSPRTTLWKYTHLKTFKSWLFKKIDPESFKDENGDWLSMTGDMAVMFPMIEMAGYEHIKHCPEINYIYNPNNPNSDHVTDRGLQYNTELYIRKQKPYERLSI